MTNMTKEHCVLPSQWCLWKANMIEKGLKAAGCQNKYIRGVIWPQHASIVTKVLQTILRQVYSEFLYGAGTVEKLHISGLPYFSLPACSLVHMKLENNPTSYYSS